MTTGPFRWVRNPIYSAMLVYLAGVALLVPNAAGLIAFGVVALGLDLHVRRVEEPYLIATHGRLLRRLCRARGPLRSGGGQALNE